eukprot:scaffold49935_cov19-Prasinocladus_malaysianus.AAC.3
MEWGYFQTDLKCYFEISETSRFHTEASNIIFRISLFPARVTLLHAIKQILHIVRIVHRSIPPALWYS